MIASFEGYLKEWLLSIGFTEGLTNVTYAVIVFFAILLLSIAADFLAKKIMLTVLTKFIRKTRTHWDDILLEKKVFNRLSHFAPAVIIYYTIGYALADYPELISVLKAGIYIYMIILSLLVLNSFIGALNDIYNTLPIARNRSIKSYIQVVKIILYFIGIILILSILMGKSPTYFLTGLGAMAAVLMLIFKDSILGLVGGIQISANDMVRLGDWISMPSQNTDGVVTEISLNTVKVQNWDKTISTLPTYSLVTESFNNWRGMEESGGRRIKRSINIDMKSVKFCTLEMIEKFKRIEVLKDYLIEKEQKLEKFNDEQDIDNSVLVNGRRLSNVGIFRKYLERYLKKHPLIHNDMTFLVRQLQPTEKGLPIEIYVFSKVQAWAAYEGIQSDIFDHVLAVIPEFDLKVFQNPTGDDFRRLAR